MTPSNEVLRATPPRIWRMLQFFFLGVRVLWEQQGAPQVGRGLFAPARLWRGLRKLFDPFMLPANALNATRLRAPVNALASKAVGSAQRGVAGVKQYLQNFADPPSMFIEKVSQSTRSRHTSETSDASYRARAGYQAHVRGNYPWLPAG